MIFFIFYLERKELYRLREIVITISGGRCPHAGRNGPKQHTHTTLFPRKLGQNVSSLITLPENVNHINALASLLQPVGFPVGVSDFRPVVLPRVDYRCHPCRVSFQNELHVRVVCITFRPLIQATTSASSGDVQPPWKLQAYRTIWPL